MKLPKLLTEQEEISFLVFLFHYFISVIASNNTSESSKDFMVLIIPFLSSLEINKVNLFPVLTAPFPLFFSNFFITFEAKLLTNPGKLSVAKRMATFVSAFLPKLPIEEPIYPPD